MFATEEISIEMHIYISKQTFVLELDGLVLM